MNFTITARKPQHAYPNCRKPFATKLRAIRSADRSAEYDSEVCGVVMGRDAPLAGASQDPRLYS